jgi:hypothetical protein
VSEFNLTIGQGIDLLLQNKDLESNEEHDVILLRDAYGRVDWIEIAQDGLCEKTKLDSFVDRYSHLKFREYIEPAKSITWYRPKYTWNRDYTSPHFNTHMLFYRDKETYLKKMSLNEKVLEWETIEAPETWEQCE